MKTIKLGITTIVILCTIYSCNNDKQSQLTKLKDQKSTIETKIIALETEINSLANTDPDPESFRLVGTTEIIAGTFDHYIRVQGKLDGDRNAAVFAEAPGTIIAKYADVGQKVVKGQVLAQIDDEQYRSQMQSLETQYEFSKDLYEKQKRLWDQQIGSEVQYLQAKTSKESLEQQIASLKQQVDKFKIKSPIDGTIEECNIKIGGVVTPDPRLAAYRVVEFKNLKVTAEVSEAYSIRVEKNDRLLVSFPDADTEVETVVSFVSNYINPVNRTFMIETEIKGNVPDLKANMIAIIQINDYHSENSVQVPMNVIQNDALGTYVYVVRQKGKYNAAFKQPVIIGNSYNGVAEIVEGLTPGDRLISIGYQELVDGEFVRF